MELGLGGKAAIVTGGSKGIGRATAIGFAAEGASVLVCARGRDALDETVKLAHARDGARVEAIQADLNKPEDVKRVAARCVEAFGKIDILVNNAGSARPGDFQKLTDDEWLEDWNLKFFGYVRMAREVLPTDATTGSWRDRERDRHRRADSDRRLYDRRLGECRAESFYQGVGERRIEAWRARRRGESRADFHRPAAAVYRASRSGRDMNEVLKRMTPLGRPGKAEEVADLVMFLASERAAFIHGANITIDGGANPGLIG